MTDDRTYQQPLSADDDFRDTILRFVRQSPPNEENEVFHSLETIIGGTGDISQFKEDHFRQLHLDTFHAVSIPGGRERTLITPYGELDPNHYLDPRTNQVLTYTHSDDQVSSVEPSREPLTDFESVRKAVEDAVTPVVNKDYADAVVSVYAAQTRNGDQIIVCINSTQARPSAMWGGRWKSCWVIDLVDGKCPITGTSEVDAHFYEAGNVSFKSSQKFTGSANLGTDLRAFGTAVAQFIQSKERELHIQIDEAFHRLSEDAFKALRRKLPVTRTKIDWDNFALQGGIGKAN